MTTKKRQIIHIVFIIFSFFVFCTSLAETSKDIRLYTLNCGYVDIHDMSSFSDTNFYPHQTFRLAAPCFLIQHPKGWLLWDTGLGDQYLNQRFDDKKHGITEVVPVSLIAQLRQLGLTPDSITYVGLSHTHFDHTGNIALFSNATFLMQRSEYEFIQQRPLSSAVDQSTFSILKDKHKILLKGDYDVFGDHTVLILFTPGHTPGHESLEIVLPNQGVIVLSGDLYHTRQAYLHRLVPVFNTSRTDTLSSMDRVNAILRDTHGRLIIQHDSDDFASLPKMPEYLN